MNQLDFSEPPEPSPKSYSLPNIVFILWLNMKSVGVKSLDIRHIAICKSARPIQCLLMKYNPYLQRNGEELLPKSVLPRMSFHPMRKELMCQTIPLVNIPKTKTHLKWNLSGNFKENQKEWLRRDLERRIPSLWFRCSQWFLRTLLNHLTSSLFWRQSIKRPWKGSAHFSWTLIGATLFSHMSYKTRNNTSHLGVHK